MLFAFGLTNLSMLGWLAAVAAPVLIHLWTRRRHRQTPWAAMEYLLAAAKRQTRRLRLRQWLLLAIRMLLVGVVVFAVAEPYVERPGTAASSGGHALRVLVVDGSFSMGCRQADRTRFDRAKEIARQIVADSPQGDAFMLVMMSSPPQVIVAAAAMEQSEIEREINNLRLTHLPADLTATVAAVCHLIGTAGHDRPRLAKTEVYFLTDLQRATWAPKLPAAAAAEFSRQTKALNRLANVSVIDLGQPAVDNLAVTGLRALDPLLLVGQPVQFEVQLTSFTRQDHARQPVELFIDGRRIEQGDVGLAAGATASVRFAYRFDSPGDHTVEVRAEGDALDVDNHRFLAVRLRQAIRTLCIDGRPSGVPFHGAADYLAVALCPQDHTGARGVVRTETATESAITDRDLGAYDCVLLCNVARFTSAEARVLDAYLRGGGGLVFFLGDQVMAESYNRELGIVGEGRGVAPAILPARLGAVCDGRPRRLDPLGFRHPIVQPFRGRGEAALVTTPILKYFKLTLASDAPANTVLAMPDGDPLVVEGPVHRGRVVLVGTAAEPRSSWTAMPLVPSFVPLVQEIVAWCARRNPRQSNVMAGQPLDVRMSGSAADGPLTMQTPDGHSRQIPLGSVSDRAGLQYADTGQSGIYVVRFGAKGSQVFAVNVDPAESDLMSASPNELDSNLRPHVRFGNPASQDGGIPHVAVPLRTGGLPVGLLYVAIGLLFADTFLAWKMGR